MSRQIQLTKLEKYCMSETAILVEWHCRKGLTYGCFLFCRETPGWSGQIQLIKFKKYGTRRTAYMRVGGCWEKRADVRMFAPFSAEKYIWLVWTNTVEQI